MKIDISKENLPDGLPLEKDKIANKANASVILRTDDSLHKLASSTLDEFKSL